MCCRQLSLWSDHIQYLWSSQNNEFLLVQKWKTASRGPEDSSATVSRKPEDSGNIWELERYRYRELGFCYCSKAQEPINNLSCSLNLSLVLQHGSQTEVGCFFSAWPKSRQTQCTFMHWSDVSACSLTGKNPCSLKLFRLWAATILTLSIGWVWILGCSTGWRTERSSPIEWQQLKTVVIVWSSPWKRCRCWKIENRMGTKNKKQLSVGWEPHILLE